MSVTITVSEGVARHLNSLSFDQVGDIDIKLRILLEAEYRRRLARHSLTDRELARKYGMSFEEFEKRQMTRQKGYSWDAESDAMAWETAADGIRTVRRQLAELTVER
ncbi:hypothetical protein QUF72_20065 [Desulfobacterales bacterium HSG2]|nr:hypothetical protein [Desulfobacterales bacterium HSG2]